MSANRFCSLVNVTKPVQQAAMTRVTTAALVAAVSDAGGLGMFPVGRSDADSVLVQLAKIRALTSGSFGVGFIVPFLEQRTVEAIAEQVNIVEFFYGWPDPGLVLPGTITGWQVGTLDEAKAAVDAGCAFVIAQGVEAGGHVRSTVPLNPLLVAIRAVVDVPVVAAGGIGTAADVRAAFALGADAVRIGTRLLGAVEADIHPRYSELLIAAKADDAQYTTVFDVGWPNAPQRVLASAVAAAIFEGPDPAGLLGTTAIPRRGTTPPTSTTTGDIDAMALYAGRSVGALREVRPAAEILRELLAETLWSDGSSACRSGRTAPCWARKNDAVQFSPELHDGVASGSITLSYRLWTRPKVKVGNLYRSGAVTIQIDDIEVVPFSSMTDDDLAATGESDRESLRKRAAHSGPIDEATLLYRVEFHVVARGAS